MEARRLRAVPSGGRCLFLRDGHVTSCVAVINGRQVRFHMQYVPMKGAEVGKGSCGVPPGAIDIYIHIDDPKDNTCGHSCGSR